MATAAFQPQRRITFRVPDAPRRDARPGDAQAEGADRCSGLCKCFKLHFSSPRLGLYKERIGQRNGRVWDERHADVLGTASAAHVLRQITMPLTGTQTAVLRDLLSDDECARMVSAAEQTGFLDQDGLRAAVPDIQIFFLKASEARMCYLWSEAFAAKLWERVRPFVSVTRKHMACGVGAYQGFNGLCNCDGNYVAVGVNPLCRILKYEPGQTFHAHQDTTYRYTSLGGKPGQYRSGLTIALYLNEHGADFTGGELRFTHPESVSIVNGKPVREAVPYSPSIELPPQRGSAVLFDPDETHESRPLQTGVKYMLQTDVVYAREDLM